MKLGTLIATTLMISVVGIAGAQGKAAPKAKGTGMTQAEWQTMYDGAAKMFDAKDAEGILSSCTPDFKITMMGKTENRKKAMADMKTWFAMMKTMSCSMHVVKVAGNDKTATVVDKFNNTGMTNPDPKTHKSSKLVDTGTETATWTKVKGKWMMKKLVISDEKMTMDGKPFMPKM